MASVSITNRIKYNNQNYTQIVSMNDDKATDNVLSLFKIFVGQQTIAQLIEKDSSYSFKFDKEGFSALNFDNNFKGSELEKIIKDDELKIITSTDKDIPVTLKEKNNKELVFEVESTKKDVSKAFKITIDAVSITIDYDGKKYLADITEIEKEKLSESTQKKFELDKKKPIFSFDVNSSLFEKLVPDNIKDLKSSNLPLYMLTQYVDLLQSNNITDENQSIDAKNINDKLKVFKYSFTPENKDNYFAFVKEGEATHILFGKKLGKIKDCKLYYSLNNKKEKEYSLIISIGKDENVKLNLSSLGDEQGKEFLQNFDKNIQPIVPPSSKVSKTDSHWGFIAQPMDDREAINYEINKNGITFSIEKKQHETSNADNKSAESKKTKAEESEEKDENKKEDKKHKFNTKFFGDLFTTLSFFSLIASALIPGLGAIMAGFAVAFMAGGAISYSVDSYELSIHKSVKKLKENAYTQFRENDSALQKAKANLKEAQASLQNAIESSNEDSFTKQFINLYKENGIVKENINLAQRYNFATGKDADLETLINLEKYETETNKNKKEKLKEEILNKFDEEKRSDIEQKLFNQSSFFDIEQLNVQGDVYNNLNQIEDEKNKEERLKLQNDFVKRYFPSVSEEKVEETRKKLFDDSKDREAFSSNLSNYINIEKIYTNTKERNIKLIEENKIDYLINLFSKREEKECTKMLSDYGETIARRFAYGKEFSETQLRKFIQVLPQKLQEQSNNLLKQKFNKIDRSIDNLHQSTKSNVDENNKLDQAFNFLKYTINSNKIPFDEFNDVLKYLPEDISTKAKTALKEGKTFKEFLVKEINKNTKMHKYLCSILNLKKFKVNDDLTLQATFKNGTEKNVMLSEQNLNNLIERYKKENNSNSTRKNLILSNILSEKFIEKEIKNTKKIFNKNKQLGDVKEQDVIKPDQIYRNIEETKKYFIEEEKIINQLLNSIDKNLNNTNFDKTLFENDLKSLIDNINLVKNIVNNGMITLIFNELKEQQTNFNSNKIKSTLKDIKMILETTQKGLSKQLAKQNKKTIQKQNYISNKSGKEIQSSIKLITKPEIQDYIQTELITEDENLFDEEILEEEKE